jgi:hypothetical protein
MIAIVVIGSLGVLLLGSGLTLLFKKPLGGVIPPKGPPIALLVSGTVLFAVALWGNKNPRKLDRLLRPTASTCPQLLTAGELHELTQEKATQFTGRKVEGGWCEYDFELRSGKKFKGKVELDLTVRQDEWVATCGNHPLTQGAAEVWMKKLPGDEQLLCFITTTFQGAIWLEKDADGLRWIRVLQNRLRTLIDGD